jgi:hypothetical protein
MNPIDLDRFAKCPALAARGATTGERAAAHVAAERIAASASLTLADARLRPVRPSVGAVPPHARGPYAWAQPKESIKPITAEELLRQ